MSFGITNLSGFGAGAGGESLPPLSIAYGSSKAWVDSGTGTNPQNFTSMTFGTATATRRVVAVIQYYNFTTSTPPAYLSSVTIGGVSATLAKRDRSAHTMAVEYWIANVPTGATGTVAITKSGSHRLFVTAHTYVLDGLSSDTPTSTASDPEATVNGISTSATCTLSNSAGDVCIFATSWDFGGGPAGSFANSTEDDDSGFSTTCGGHVGHIGTGSSASQGDTSTYSTRRNVCMVAVSFA